MVNKKKAKRFPDGWFGPVALAVLAFAGPLKSTPALDWLPIDLTFAAAAVVALATVASRLKHGPASGKVAIPLVLMTVFLFGVFGSSLDGYSLSKIVALYTLTFAAMLAPFYTLRTEPQRRLFITTLVAIAVFVGILTVVAPSQDVAYANVRLLEGSNTISTAQMLAAGVVTCLILAIAAKIKPSQRAMLALLGGALAYSTLGTGSRGPFFAIGLAVFGVIILAPMFAKFRGRAITAAVLLSAGALFLAIRDSGDGVARILGFVSGQQDNSVSVRTYLLGEAFQNISASPIGIGWGNFVQIPGLWRYSGDDRLYPHNVIAEVMLEAGWLAGTVLCVYMVATLIRGQRVAITPVSAVIFGLTIFAAFNSLVSGDVNDNRLMWMMLSCVWVLQTQDSTTPTGLSRSSSTRAGSRQLRSSLLPPQPANMPRQGSSV